MIPNLRVTLITSEGEVLYDNTQKKSDSLRIIARAKKYKMPWCTAVDILSAVTQKVWTEKNFLFGTLLSGQTNNNTLSPSLQCKSERTSACWFRIHLVYYYHQFDTDVYLLSFTHKLGTSITQLQQFALKADRNEPIDLDILESFPKNELGEISQHIIKIYKRLHRAKEALYIEREKLISHLQTSHEGLGVFTRERNEILVNNLLTQYANTISDHNLTSTEEVFSIPELAPITDFLNRNEGNFHKEEKDFHCISTKTHVRSQ